MERLIDNYGLIHLATQIFAYLDNESLLQSQLVCKSWLNFLQNQRFFWKRKLRAKSGKVSELNQDWQKLVSNIEKKGSVEDILSLISIMEKFKGSCLHFGITPLHQAIFSGDLELISFILPHFNDPLQTRNVWRFKSNMFKIIVFKDVFDFNGF